MKVALYERKRSKIEFVKEFEVNNIEDYRKQSVANRNQCLFVVENRIYDNEGLICLIYGNAYKK